MLKADFTILIVDDNMINLKLIKSMLMKSGIVREVLEAKSGSQAIDFLRERGDIDLILLDIVMPVMSGIELLKIVRADDILSKLPVIILTTDDTKKHDSFEFGANDFLMKPVKKDDLIQKISNILL